MEYIDVWFKGRGGEEQKRSEKRGRRDSGRGVERGVERGRISMVEKRGIIRLRMHYICIIFQLEDVIKPDIRDDIKCRKGFWPNI